MEDPTIQKPPNKEYSKIILDFFETFWGKIMKYSIFYVLLPILLTLFVGLFINPMIVNNDILKNKEIAAHSIYTDLNASNNKIIMTAKLLANTTICSNITWKNGAPPDKLISQSDPYTTYRKDIDNFDGDLYYNIDKYYSDQKDAENYRENLRDLENIGECNNITPEAQSYYDNMKSRVINCNNRIPIIKNLILQKYPQFG